MGIFDKFKKKKTSEPPEPTSWKTRLIDGRLYLINSENPKQKVLMKDVKADEKFKQILKETKSKRLTTTQTKKLLDRQGIERTPDTVSKIKRLTKKHKR